MEWNKKAVLCIAIFMAWSNINTKAQGIGQWFNQKQTQTKYLAQQLAALKMYSGYLKRGYTVVKDGLNTISDLKNGHFKLDQVFFDSLEVVNPRIRSAGIVTETLSLQNEIENLLQLTIKIVRKSDHLGDSEADYTQKVCRNIRLVNNQLINELKQVLTNGVYKMSDDERLKHITSIHQKAEEQYKFVQRFYIDLKKLELQKRKEANDVKVLKEWYP